MIPGLLGSVTRQKAAKTDTLGLIPARPFSWVIAGKFPNLSCAASFKQGASCIYLFVFNKKYLLLL